MTVDGSDGRSLRFAVLGPVRAWSGGEEVDLGAAKQRAVLAILVLELGRPVPTARIVDAVWGDDPPANGPNVVQKYIAGLRRALEPDRQAGTASQLLALTAAGYLLPASAGIVDCEEFAEQVRLATLHRHQGRPREAAGLLRAALQEWQGEPLAGLPGEFFAAARRRLEESRAAAGESLAEDELELGRYDVVVSRVRGMLAHHPARERLRELLMLALYRSGRPAEALGVYREARAYLIDEFGTEPSASLRELHQRILRGDPALRPPRPPEPVQSAAQPPPAVPDGGWRTPAGDSPAVAPSRPGPGGPAGPAFAHDPVGWPQPIPPALPPAWTAPAVTLRGRWGTPLAKLAAMAAPLVSFGLATWLVFVVLASVRRSRALAACAAWYFGVIVFAVALLGQEDPLSDLMDGIVTGLLVLNWIGGGLHVAWLLLLPGHARPPLTTSLDAREKRDLARRLVLEFPDAARAMAVGRPDLPRTLDDGGLIDINAAPYALLVCLPGIGPGQARRIISDRELRGPYGEVRELLTREVLPVWVLAPLQDVLVAVPPGGPVR